MRGLIIKITGGLSRNGTIKFARWFFLLALVLFVIPLAIALRPAGSTITLFAVLVAGTFISEDLTCLSAGALVAEGHASFPLAVAGCLVGIFLGDMLLFLAGRAIGRTVIRRAPVKWFVREADVDRATAWFERRGFNAILLSRFIPGTRLPTYVAAGLLRTNALKFTGYFLGAAGLWTPLLVGAAAFFGRWVVASVLGRGHLLLWLGLFTVVAYFVVRFLIRLTTYRGRRELVGRWRRVARWEFWPLWAFYPPVVIYILYLGLKYRSFTLFTSANPSIEEGGFVGESKSAILHGLGQTPNGRAHVANWRLLRADLSPQARLEASASFMCDLVTGFPVVLKPDHGERGAGVAIVRSQPELERYLRSSAGRDVIIQQYVAGEEFGVFYYRHPTETRGRIFSITRKAFPSLTGDGIHSRERLILQDDRAVCLAKTYLETQGELREEIPSVGESFPLIDIGTHCRGAIFQDGNEFKTLELEDAIDRLAHGFPGFYFGRFDLRTPSLEDFCLGRSFQVVELNGVTSEATHIYDPKHSILAAYRTLFEQWRIAFAIGAQNRAAGTQPATLRTLARKIIARGCGNDERNRPAARPINARVNAAAPLTNES
jgi:membrane protein DedA with SNARE-associated domain